MSMKYPPPVSALLTYGNCQNLLDGGPGPHGWPDYPAELGIGQRDIPHLIEMIHDDDLNQEDGDSLAIWAPTHAWRTLGELQAEDAIEPLLRLLEADAEDEWVMEEVPMVLALIGPKAITPVCRLLTDDQLDEQPRIVAADALRCIAEYNPEVRDLCLAKLVDQLARGSVNNRTLNGFIVNNLMTLEAVEALEPIRQAFQNGQVDTSIPGDLEEVEICLGVREKRSTPRPRYGFPFFQERLQPLVNPMRGVGRNDLCPCGSGKKYKRCCLERA